MSAEAACGSFPGHSPLRRPSHGRAALLVLRVWRRALRASTTSPDTLKRVRALSALDLGTDLGAKEAVRTNLSFKSKDLIAIHGGRGGIRTHEGLTPLAVFKTAALNHSATLPAQQDQLLIDSHS
jgi:hypothetical protein